MKTMSRQRKWQIKKKNLGLCQICGEKEVSKGYCEYHRLKNNEASKKYCEKNREKYRKYSKEYRITHSPKKLI